MLASVIASPGDLLRGRALPKPLCDGTNATTVDTLFARYNAIAGDPTAAAVLTLAHAMMLIRQCADNDLDAHATGGSSADGTALTVKQAAERLNVPPSAVYSLIGQKKLPHHRFGKGRGRIRILPSDLEAFERDTAVAKLPAPSTRPAMPSSNNRLASFSSKHGLDPRLCGAG